MSSLIEITIRFVQGRRCIRKSRQQINRMQDSYSLWRPRAFAILILAIYFLQGPALCKAAPILELGTNTKNLTLLKYYEYLEDSKGKLKLEDLIARNDQLPFKTNDAAISNFGIRSTIIWVKIQFVNRSEVFGNWYLCLEYPGIDRIAAYLPEENGGFVELSSGDALPFDFRTIKHRFHVFPLSLAPNQLSTVYFRLQNDGLISIPLYLYSPREFLAQIKKQSLLWGLFFGLLLAILTTSLFFLLRTKTVWLTYFVLFLVSHIIFLFSFKGLAFEYFWPNSPNWGNYSTIFFGLLGIIFFTLFWRRFSLMENLGSRSEQVFNLTFLIILFHTILIPVQAVFYKSMLRLFATELSVMLCLIWMILLVIRGISLWLIGNSPGKYLLFAWGTSLTFFVVYLLAIAGVFQVNSITNNSIPAGSLLMLIIVFIVIIKHFQTINVETDSGYGNRPPASSAQKPHKTTWENPFQRDEEKTIFQSLENNENTFRDSPPGDILKVYERYSKFATFSEQISRLSNHGYQIELAFRSLAKDPYVSEAALFYQNRLVDQRGSDLKEIETVGTSGGLPHGVTLAKKGDRNLATIRIKGFDNYHILLQSRDSFSDYDIAFYNMFVAQILIVRNNLLALIKDKKWIHGLHTILSCLEEIVYIRADKGYCIIYDRLKSEKTIVDLSLKNINACFDDSVLMQVHRSYLINPKHVEEAARISRTRVAIMVSGSEVPIGKSHLSMLKTRFPHWFTREKRLQQSL